MNRWILGVFALGSLVVLVGAGAPRFGNQNATSGDSATAFFSSGTIEHERGGLQADVSAFTGLVAITGADTTAEIDSKSELQGQIADVSDFAMADGDVYTGVHDFGGASIEVENGASPPACVAGELFVDTDATSGQRLMACETTTFVTQGVGSTGDAVSIDSVAVADPDFVSTDDIDFINTSNTVTAAIKASVVDNTAMADDAIGAAEMADADHGAISWTSGVATVEDLACTACVDATDMAANSVAASEMADDAIAAAEMEDADHGDVNWTSGVATVQAVDASIIDNTAMADDAIAADEMADDDFGDFTCATSACTLDAGVVDKTAIGANTLTNECITKIIDVPNVNSDFLLGFHTVAFTVDEIKCIVDPADTTESAVIQLYESDTSGDAATDLDTGSDVTCDNDGAADDGTLANPSIAANTWVGINVGTVTGTVTSLTVTYCGTDN